MTGRPTTEPRRVLLKLSGQALKGDGHAGISPAAVDRMARSIAAVRDHGIEPACVIGGGNIYRGLGAETRGMDRVTADSMGLLATLINALAVQEALEKLGCRTRMMSAITVRQVAEPFIRRRALRHLEKGRIVLFAAGTGNPYFSTDTAAALRGSEIRADVLIKATRVPGVFTSDPERDPDARPIRRLTYLEAIGQELRFMDTTAISLCKENDLPIVVCHQDDIQAAARGADVGTRVDSGTDPYQQPEGAQADASRNPG